MKLIRGSAALALCGALAGCGFLGAAKPGGAASAPPSAQVGLGAAASVIPSPSAIDEVIFRTPSRNIFCDLHKSFVRCDIIRKSWKPPAKPADCDFDWGNGVYISTGKAGLTCASDTLIGETEAVTLEYGHAYRSGDVTCTSESIGLTCKDDKTGRGFTLAMARYSLF